MIWPDNVQRASASYWQVQRMIAHGPKVLEFGSGPSTLLFAELGATITSVDNNQRVHELIKEQKSPAVTLILSDAKNYDQEEVPDVVFVDFGFRTPKFEDRIEVGVRWAKVCPTYIHDLPRMGGLSRVDATGTLVNEEER